MQQPRVCAHHLDHTTGACSISLSFEQSSCLLHVWPLWSVLCNAVARLGGIPGGGGVLRASLPVSSRVHLRAGLEPLALLPLVSSSARGGGKVGGIRRVRCHQVCSLQSLQRVVVMQFSVSPFAAYAFCVQPQQTCAARCCRAHASQCDFAGLSLLGSFSWGGDWGVWHEAMS
jgi:hypothetical protein